MIQHERHQEIKIMNQYQSKGLMYGILCLGLLLGQIAVACPPDCGSCYVWNGYECIYLGDLWCDDCEALNASCTGCDDICPEGYMCVGDYCKQECEDDSDCDATRCMACSNGDYCTYQCQSGEDCINSTCVPESTCNPGCASGYSCANGVCVDDDGGICNPSCGEGYTCVSGTCVPIMTCNPACGEDETCVNGSCVPSCPTPCNSSNCEYCDASIGGCVGCPEGYSCDAGECKLLCLDDLDCGDCEICIDYLCEGYCLEDQLCVENECITLCETDSDCGECESCSEAGECIYECEEEQQCVNDKCLDSCEDNSDCSEGEQCSETGVCQPEDGGGSCDVQGDCLEDQSCINGVCVEDGDGCNPECLEDETCINETCVPNEGIDECDPLCPTGYVCINGVCVPDNDSTCVPACGEDEICANGVCIPTSGCTQDSDCPAGLSCVNNTCVDTGADCCESCSANNPCKNGMTCINGECYCVTGNCIDGKCVSITLLDIDFDHLQEQVVNCPVTFTALTIPSGYENQIQWNGDGSPLSGSGESFTTSWSQAGTKYITAEIRDCRDNSARSDSDSIEIIDWYKYTCLTCCNNIIPTPGYDPTTDPTIDGCSNPVPILDKDDPTGSPPWCGDSSFLEACNHHDIGYRTCQRPKQTSDNQFRSDMDTVCDNLSSEGDACANFKISCYIWAQVYHTAVEQFGDEAPDWPYSTNQLDRACVCKDCYMDQ